jgi:two-component system OmpR family response regulator
VGGRSVLRSLSDGALVLGRGDDGDRRLMIPEAEPPESANAAASLLLVDPDPGAFQACQAVLGGQGYVLAHAPDLAAARARLQACAYDLVILELDLPNEDGLAFCREIAAATLEGRAGGARILIHSRRAQSIDRVAGLEFGADDYIDKACHPVEVLARVRALLRRGAPPAQEPPVGPRAFVFDRWRYDAGSGALTAPDGGATWLSGAEQALLGVFLDHPRELLTRARIEAVLFTQAQQLSGRVIDVRVVRLRRAFETCAPGGGDLIRTVRGAGYLLRATVTHRPDA